MNRQFETPEPIELYVEIGKGKVEFSAGDTHDHHARHRRPRRRRGPP